MISSKALLDIFKKYELDFFTGVPDSLLKDFCACAADHVDYKMNIIAANEGGAIALATGYHLATGKIGVVFMQNSGLGNAINPLTSLTSPEVYSIPMLLLIGWRGEPGTKDEPQHIKQGKITTDLLDSLDIPFEILPESLEEVEKVVNKIIYIIKKNCSPCALIVRKNTFQPYNPKKITEEIYKLSREDSIKSIINSLDEKDIIVSTTGKISRELLEYRKELKQEHDKDLLTIGSMGHCSQIALEIALSKPDRQVYCLDGDGAVIMHMGALAIIGSRSPLNFKHIILNNGAHESVGGQPTVAFDIDLVAIAKACGYKRTFKTENNDELKEKINLLKSSEGPALLEIRINKISKENLGRPNTKPIENKSKFMKYLLEK